MATITKRGEAQWQAKIRRAGHKTLSQTFETYDAAKEWADVTEGKISGREYVDRDKEQRAKLRDLLTRYQDEITPTKKGARQERVRIGQWLAEPMADWSLAAVTSVDVADWRRRREAEGKAPSTISNAMNLLSAVYKVAISEWGYRVTNPVTGVRRPKARPARWATLSADEEARLLDACRAGPSWLAWCVRVALVTAMRAAEIRRLHWDHIHQTHVHLPEVKSTTGEERSRDVPLTAAGLAVIEEMRTALPRRLDGWVFGPPDTADGITKDMLSQAFRDATAKAEISITFHDLRHVATTRLAPLHKDVLELAATTGHKTLNQLKRYYNPTPEERAAELRAREAAAARKKRAAAKKAGGAEVVQLRRE
jgi:integrase